MSVQTTARFARLDVAFVRLRRLWESPVLRRRFIAAMGEAIDPGVIRTLRVVDAGNGGGVSAVAADLGVEPSTASRLVDAAVSAGYLQRTPSELDRRRTVLAVTDTGAEVLARALRVREDLMSELTADWTDDDVEQLATLLERLSTSVADIERHQ